MAKPKKKRKLVAPTVLPPESQIERDTQMFREWIGGKTYEEIAALHGLAGKDAIYLVAKKHNWRQLKRDLAARVFSRTVDGLKDTTVKAIALLDRDIDRIITEFNADPKSKLSKEERDHIRSMIDRYLKETRLEDGKPTEHIGGNVKTELVLPPGVKGFGIIPPDPRVMITQQEPEAKPETIDLDEIDGEDK